jgi:hypothetical protein
VALPRYEHAIKKMEDEEGSLLLDKEIYSRKGLAQGAETLYSVL